MQYCLLYDMCTFQNWDRHQRDHLRCSPYRYHCILHWQKYRQCRKHIVLMILEAQIPNSLKNYVESNVVSPYILPIIIYVPRHGEFCVRAIQLWTGVVVGLDCNATRIDTCLFSGDAVIDVFGISDTISCFFDSSCACIPLMKCKIVFWSCYTQNIVCVVCFTCIFAHAS